MIRPRLRGLAVIVLVATLAALAGCSDDGGGSAELPPGVDEVVDVSMTEMAYSPNDFTFGVGETVMFRFHNDGTVRHEAVIGDQAAQDAAMAAMAAMASSTTTTAPTGDEEGARGRSRPAVAAIAHPGMGLPNLISVEPGRTGEITFQFAKPTTLLMQCHEAGHLEGGMTATITINA